ncbi:MAG: hypothetical protein JXR40_07125 [Pontiellaceae bacterium]|nr:hypothetical protein [Pontiellaceae bacterium]
MKITLEIRHIFIPFRFAYGHSKAAHRGVESVICIARDEHGKCGIGEAVPRRYVTGENCDSVLADSKKIFPPLAEAATSIDSLRTKLIETENRWEGPFPSCAFCMIDLALTDLLTQKNQAPFYSAYGDQRLNTLSYSGSIGMGKKSFLYAQLLAYRTLGLKSFKLKVGSKHDMESLRVVRKILGNEVRILADANGAWDRETAIRRIEDLHSMGVWAIEEPLIRRTPHETNSQHDCEATLDDEHYQNNAWLRKRSPIALIADESVISLRSLQRAIEHDAFDIVDIRLSKLGGGILSTHRIQQAVHAGMQFYVGAMVGESAILATAGSQFGSVHADHLLIQGHSHRALHRRKIAAGEPRLHLGGTLKLGEPIGLGVSLNQHTLDQMTQKIDVLKS